MKGRGFNEKSIKTKTKQNNDFSLKKKLNTRERKHDICKP